MARRTPETDAPAEAKRAINAKVGKNSAKGLLSNESEDAQEASMERCPSGLRCRPGKSVYVNSVPRVRISPAPPLKSHNNSFSPSALVAEGVFVCKKTQEKTGNSREKLQSRQKVGNAQSGFLSIGQAAKRYHIAERTLRHWCETGKLSAMVKPFGKKMTYQVVPQAVEMLLKTLEQEAPAHPGTFAKPGQHKNAVKKWQSAMAVGAMTGKVFSPLTISLYVDYVTAFLKKHPVVTIDSFKREMMDIPAEGYYKRYKLYKAIVSFAKFLIQEAQLDKSFLDAIKPFSPKPHKPPKRHTVEADALQKLLNACKNGAETFMITLLASTGLRASEACALRWQDVDTERAILTVQRGKGGKRRQLGISASLIEAFKPYAAEHPDSAPESFLLMSKSGQPQTRFGLGRQLLWIGARADVKVTPHALRRAFVTLNANKGRPLQMLQIACGHSDIKTTMSYCRTSEQEVIDAMQGWD